MNFLLQQDVLGSSIKNIELTNNGLGCDQLLLTLSNGYVLSILSGGLAYTKGGTFEVAILQDDNIVSPLDKNGDGVYGYLSSAEVADLVKKVSYLKDERLVKVD